MFCELKEATQTGDEDAQQRALFFESREGKDRDPDGVEKTGTQGELKGPGPRWDKKGLRHRQN